ncbi:uncharacterized protein N7515_008513 [Penicillium bovifimosum]|uniref:Hpc2-related domain-containing protein n=1 Tax=Penicillium bovifimosum TaxID=126998 RepID=A0A9W9KXX0_9EURO|nr:uncharacterized protein N7515_008513 [Penicillium bovifimosum]KAJ5124688.1 hypothetical protein N7515_008513 [Penicillium bovifimosum]
MSTDPPNMDVLKEEHIESDAKPGTSARRASGTARRSRRKKEDEPGTKTTKKDKEPNTKEPKEAKEKPARAPRRPREKTNNNTSRKKPKLEPAVEATASAPVVARSPPNAPVAHQPAHSAIPTQPTLPAQSAPTSYSSPQPPTVPTAPYQLSQPPRPQLQSPAPQQPPQRTSGQNFDPIRSAFDNPFPAPAYSPPARPVSPRNAYRASASPAISSIIDPPSQTSQSAYTPLQRSSSGHVSGISSPVPPMASAPSHPSLAHSPLPTPSPSHGLLHTPQPVSQSSHYTTPYPPTEQRPTPLQTPAPEPSPPAMRQPQPPAQTQPEPTAQPTPPKQQQAEAMEVDPKGQPAASAKKEKSTATAPASKAPSPKAAKPAKEAPQLPQGSGLITNALFGGVDDSANPSDSRTTPNIIVHIPLQKGNQIVNFARLAEEQYGFAALHPRLAAHKARLARVAAASAALERNDKSAKGISAGETDEDLSLDAERDSDVDGDVAMGGTSAGTNGAPSEASDGKKKRRKKVEEYDRDDPFVDDTEMVWQEQAAASKDGFFVYSGPLVPEGEKVQVERADGTIKRGRGRGRGTGRGRSAASHPHVPIAAAVPISQDTGLPLRGPGSRGGTTRRPRGNKKADGEKHANASTASGRGGSSGSSRGGSNSARGGKSSASVPMPDIAPSPSTPSIVPAPPGPSPLAGSELTMK